MSENKKPVTKKTKPRVNLSGLLSKMPLFDKLNGEELKILRKFVSVVDVKKSTRVFSEGDAGDYVCFITDGKLQIYKTAGDGSRTVLAYIPAGRSLGEMALVDHFSRSATAVAVEDTRLVTLSSDNFNVLTETHPRLSNKILQEFARLLSLNLRKTSANLVSALH